MDIPHGIVRQFCDACNLWAASADGQISGKACGFLPETFASDCPCACVTVQAGEARLRTYVDGTVFARLPLAVTLRLADASPAEKLAALAWFARLERYLANFSPGEASLGETAADAFYHRCRMTVRAAKTYAGADGTEEYRAVFALEYTARAAHSPTDAPAAASLQGQGKAEGVEYEHEFGEPGGTAALSEHRH